MTGVKKWPKATLLDFEGKCIPGYRTVFDCIMFQMW